MQSYPAQLYYNGSLPPLSSLSIASFIDRLFAESKTTRNRSNRRLEIKPKSSSRAESTRDRSNRRIEVESKSSGRIDRTTLAAFIQLGWITLRRCRCIFPHPQPFSRPMAWRVQRTSLAISCEKPSRCTEMILV